MKKPPEPPTQVKPRIAKGIVPTAIASGLFSQPTLGIPGDLDPTFGDMGRVDSALHLDGAAWSVQALAGGESFIVGGEHCGYCLYENFADGFIGQISPSGSLDLNVALALLAKTQVLDVAVQPDGKVVAVGRTVSGATDVLTVIRLAPGGSLDPNFANGGVMQYTAATSAQAVTLDPSGSIVVAGSSQGKLTVLRLLGNGTLDGSFGNAGVYIGPRHDGSARILRTAGGGYRISTNLYQVPQNPSQTPGCAVLALTAAGMMDSTFGVSGIAALNPPSGATFNCGSMTTQSDGRLLLAGQAGGQGAVSRLLASGSPDPSFAAGAVQGDMVEATSVAVDAVGSILVAGRPAAGVPGVLIVRLQATGALDSFFGNGGSTWIDVSSNEATLPVIHDMSVLADGRILAAGGDESQTNGQQPLLVRLLGTDGTGGPGVIGVTPSIVPVKEENNRTAVVTVRRMGGAAGEVSVAYRTADYTGTDAGSATSGADYTPVTGRLTWADGDRSDRQVTVPIVADTGQVVEEALRFTVTLGDVKGGAELGTQDAVVEIAADGGPAGQLGFADSAIAASETAGSVQVVVNRNYYFKGAISVTLTPVAGSATTVDFVATPITLSWADGDSQPQTATIPILNDNVVESPESFTVELSNPTNGAVIGPHSRVIVTITDDDQTSGGGGTSAGGGTSGGGGALDWLALLCLSAVRWLRRRA